MHEASERLHFATRHPADGRALRYHFDEFVLDWLPRVAHALASRPAARVAEEFVAPELVRLYLEQALYVELLKTARQIFRSRFAASQGRAAFTVGVPPDLAPILRESLPDGGVRIAPSPMLGLRSRVAGLRRRVRSILASGTAASAPVWVEGSIAVELVEGADPSRKCDAWWLAAGAIDPRRVIFVLEPLNYSLVDIPANLAAIRRLGSRIVALDPRMTAGGEIPYWRPRAAPRWSTELRARIPRPRDGAERWLSRALAALADRAAYWHAFYDDHGVLAVQQFTELSTETAIKRIAVDRLGGIEMGKMRSQFFEQASAAFHFQHEVAYVWHRNVAKYLRTGRTRTQVLVETGYVYDYLCASLADAARDLRLQLSAKPAVVACVFDNYPHRNGHFSQRDLEAFYQAVLNLAGAHPYLGVIIKSKKPEVLRTIPTISQRLAALRAAGRCLLITEPLSSVIPAALASDIALGFPASTAGCEAGLAGCSVVMYDPARARHHPWVASHKGKVFDDPESFERAAARAVGEAAKGVAMGDPVHELDAHRDRQSPRRAVQFLRAFLDARAAGNDKARSLAHALELSSGYALRMETGTP